MNVLVVYDSKYGNTQRVAETIGRALGAPVKQPVDVDSSELQRLDLLVVGSPTQGGNPTPLIKEFLDGLPPGSLEDVRAAAFDTRFSKEGHGVFLRALMAVIGFAAGKMHKRLIAKGASSAAPPEGFIVVDKRGPLREGEIDRAEAWAAGLSRSSVPS